MADISPYSEWIAKGVLKTVWGPFTGATDVGLALDASSLPDKTVSVTGTFDAATVVIQGGPSTSLWHGLNDSRGEGNALSFTAADTRAILENPQYIRFSTSGGGGSQSLTVTVISQSARR